MGRFSLYSARTVIFCRFVPVGIQIENIALNQICAYAKNAKNHPEGQVQQIAASIRQFGFNNPILVDENLEIIAGHGRVAATQILGLDTVPVIRLALIKAESTKDVCFDISRREFYEQKWAI